MALEDAAVRKVAKRLLWFLFVIYVVAFLDRSNIGFAALTMNKALGLTATTFGLANTILYLGYACFEIPSNLMFARFGARIWIPRIMITWGIAAAATILATGPASLYVVRAIVGAAEAGLSPGIYFYMSFWFPSSVRARAFATFALAPAVASALGSPVSGLLLDLDGHLGLAGWQWLFLGEGLPAVALGVIAYFYLTDRPAHATWLDPGEKAALERRLARETPPRPLARAWWKDALDARIILLGIGYIAAGAAINTVVTWGPQIIRDILGPGHYAYIGLMAAIPGLCTVPIVYLWSMHSDRTQERVLHTTLPMIVAAIGLLLVAYGGVATVRFIGLIAGLAGGFGVSSNFWTIPTRILPVENRAVGFAAISTLGIFGGILSPAIIGFFKDLTQDFAAGLDVIAAFQIVAALIIFAVAARSRMAT